MSQVQNMPYLQTVIAYIRRSSDNRQRYSLSAQRAYINDFAESHNLQVIEWFEETKSGKNMEREEWEKCLSRARETGRPIIVKSLSRLGRNAAAVINTIAEEKIIVADRGLECDKLTLNLLAVIDQAELDRISERTRLGLQRAKAAGKKLGNPRPERSLNEGRISQAKEADRFALKMLPILQPMLNSGMRHKHIADALNLSEITTRRGKRWSNSSVKNLIRRLDDLV